MRNEFVLDGESGAVFSPCRTWRYSLWRRFTPLFVTQEEERLLAYIGLNPSIANEHIDDPTMTRLISFTKAMGYDGFVMLNLFGVVSTDPMGMLKHEEPVGEDNDRAILTVASQVDAVGCCWGTHGDHRGRNQAVLDMLKAGGFNLQAFDITQDGHPKHPLIRS